MRQSQLFTKTRKNAPKDEVSKNAELLIRGGFIDKELAGVYSFLPLGRIVLNKIIQILREEMNSIDGQEVMLTSLQDPEVWKQTDRWSEKVIDVWFRTNLTHGGEIGLANTHEEPLTRLMTKHIESYKDLPKYVYQFQTKFRNEPRAKSGIMRSREFIMKDLYSFSATEQELDNYYQKVRDAYFKYFKRIGLGDYTYYTFASGGAFSKFSHEFQTICDAGEDTVYLDRNKNLAINEEVYNDEVINELGLDKNQLEKVKAVETGNIFKLGTKYSKPLGLNYKDEKGKEQPVVMGSYGIGPGRSMGTIVELFHDNKGIIWPDAIAPYQVHLIGLNLDNSDIAIRAEEVYTQSREKNIEVLFDDRKEATAGQKFADSDLIGIPYRVIVSKKSGDQLEVKRRDEEEIKIMDINKLFEIVS